MPILLTKESIGAVVHDHEVDRVSTVIFSTALVTC